MRLVGYYDGSGKSSDKNCKLLTLAGFCGGAEAWTEFEDDWLSCLREHGAPERDGVPYVHMKHATALRGGFTKANGWDDSRVTELVKGLFKVLSKTSTRIKGAAIPVMLDDFRKAASELEAPRLDSPESLCVDACLTNSVHPDADEENQESIVQLYFDRSEDFMHKARRTFEWAKCRPSKNNGWVRQTALIAPLDMHTTPGLQAADLVGWIVNRHYTGTQAGDYEYWYQWLLFVNVAMPSDAFRYKQILEKLRPRTTA